MSFFYYVDQRPLKLIIHRDDCPFCELMPDARHPGTVSDSGYWKGPFRTYELAYKEALTEFPVLDEHPISCKLCRPSETVQSSQSTGTEKQNRTRAIARKQPTNRKAGPPDQVKQLKQRHATELRNLRSFHTQMQQLMQARHKTEQQELTRSSGQTQLTVLARQAEEK